MKTRSPHALLALIVAAPAILTALALTAIETWRYRHPESAVPGTPFAYSLAEAIERDDVRRAYEFIRQGQNPNEPIAVRHPALTGGRPLLVSPLLWAVATNSRQSVLTLLGHGVTMERPANSSAACLADALGNTELAALLRRLAEGIEVAPCQERNTGDAPLVSFAVRAQ